MDWRSHWAGRTRYVILFAQDDDKQIDGCLQAWRDDPARPPQLHLIALAAGPLPGFRRLLQDSCAVTIDMLQLPPATALAQLQARIDMVCLGASFDPACARPLARLLARDAWLQGTDVSAAARAALQGSGWECIDTGDARTLRARFASRKPAAPIAPIAPAPQRQAIVIGAGLAGAAACERLCARGWQVTLIEQHGQAAMEASGNRAGITLPMLSLDDNRASRLSRAAYLFAGDYWQRLGGVGDAGAGAAIEGARCGVLLAARDGTHAALQKAIAAAHPLPPAYAQWLENSAAIGGFGKLAPHGAWLFPGGGWLRPASAVAAMLSACGTRLAARFGSGPVTLAWHASRDAQGSQDSQANQASHSGVWQVRDGAGAVLASAPVVIVASGAGHLAQTAALPLARVRGQVTHLAAEETHDTVADPGLVLCREAYLTPPAGGIRSIGATYDDDDDPRLRQSSQDENLAHLRGMLGEPKAAAGAPLAGRVGFRAVATDRLPMVGAVPQPDHTVGAERLRDLPRQPGLYALLGYASRGLTWAPLAAELLAASLEGEPLPLERDLVEALDPGRFVLRARRKKPVSMR